MRRKLLALVFVLALLAGALPLAAQDQPVVYAVLFYSPSCPHCHDLIVNDMPGIMAEFGDQLQVLLVDISNQSGSALARSAYEHYSIPQSSWVVPMMIIADQVLIGGNEIPARLPEITRAGLAAGGIAVPSFPGMREVFEIALEREADETTAETGAAVPVTDPAAALAERSLAERLAADPVANLLAIIVLGGLAVSLIAVVVAGLTGGAEPALLTGSTARLAVALTLGVGVVVGVTLVAESAGDTLATLLSWLMLAGLAGALLAALFTRAQAGLIPLVALVGLLDAVYLAYVEVTQTEAACGAVGNCNAVQQSAYAQVFGVPVGVIGIVGYVAILIAWGLTRAGSARVRRAASAALLLMVLAGVVFSIYLTFLEPFVIGATCAWCLISALTMLALLWLVAPAGWQALRESPRSNNEQVLREAV